MLDEEGECRPKQRGRDHQQHGGSATSPAVAYVDITTGEFAVTELSGADPGSALRAELVRLHPAEILHPDNFSLPEAIPGHGTPWPAWRFEPGRCQEALMRHFETTTLDGFGLSAHSPSVRAAGVILQYLKETQPAALNLLTRLSTYSTSEFVTLDAATRRNLELTETLRTGTLKGSLLGVLDHTVTPMGKRLLRQWVSKPLLSVENINKVGDGASCAGARLPGVGEVRDWLEAYLSGCEARSA